MQTKAQSKIGYKQRVVYISGSPDDEGGRLVAPIGNRIVSSTDEDLTEVHWYLSTVRNPGELRDTLEAATDFVLLVDDGVCAQLRKARVDALVNDPESGIELLVVLEQNNTREKAGSDEAPARVWLAKAAAIDTLIGLKKIAGRPDWNFHNGPPAQVLHWLYKAEERVLQDYKAIDGKRLLGDEDARLGRNVGIFVRHPKDCPLCGQPHPTS